MNRTLLCLAFVVSFSCVAYADDDLKQKYIGTASMDADGVISLHLWSREPGVGGAMLLIRKDDPDYKDVLKHMNGPKVGKWTMVEPWHVEKDKEKGNQVPAPSTSK